MTTAALQADIDKTQQQIDALAKAREDRRQKVGEVESERRKWLIAARVDNEPKAQKEIEKYADQLAAMQRDDSLDYAVLVELQGRLREQKANLDRQHRREQCLKVAALIEPHVDGKLEKRLLEVALELKDILLKLRSRDAEIGAALRQLGGNFPRVAMELPYRERDRKNAVGSILEGFFPMLGGGWCGNPPVDAAKLFGDWVELLNEECDKTAAAA